jgi:hypothetical protein
MVQIIHCLDENEPPDVFVYESDLYQYEILLAIKDAEFDIAAKKAEEKFQAELQAERQKTQAERQKTQAEHEKFQAEHKRILNAIKAFLTLGKDTPAIAGILDLTIAEVTDIVQQIKAKKP